MQIQSWDLFERYIKKGKQFFYSFCGRFFNSSYVCYFEV